MYLAQRQDVVDDFELRDGRQDTLVIRVCQNKRHVSAFGTKQVYCMRVGGDTKKEEAIENWTQRPLSLALYVRS